MENFDEPVKKIIRIALIGPESSGKTTIAEALAKHFETTWVPEYAREYIGRLERPYNREDIIHCAEMQLQTELNAIPSANKILFIDTEMINSKVWLMDVYKEENAWIEKMIAEHEYDLYLLMSPDLPFIKDPVRENPHRREYFFDWYKNELNERGFNYSVITGNGQERFLKAVDVINNYK